MPFYEYECTHCKFYIESLQKISDPPLVECPSCGKPDLKRLVSAPNFRLKGSGWYETDFKSESENKRNIAGGEEDKPSTEKESKEGKEGKEGEDKPARISRRVAVRKTDKKTASVGKKAAKKAVKKKQTAKTVKNAGKGKVKSRPKSKPTSKLKAKVKSGSAKKKSVKKNAARKK